MIYDAKVLVGTQDKGFVGGIVFRIYDKTLDADEVRYNYSCESLEYNGINIG